MANIFVKIKRKAIKVAGKSIPENKRGFYARYFYGDSLFLGWHDTRNFGDALSPVIVEIMSSKRVFHRKILDTKHYLCAGSVLGTANDRSIIWGSGFIRKEQKVQINPLTVHAVRGPLSRKMLLESGIKCPDIYGDPVALMPYFYNPELSKKYKYGIVPHYCDYQNKWVLDYKNDPMVSVLNVKSDPWKFIQKLKSCDIIISSSLHGIITAHAYGIPAVWVKMSDKLEGGDFKFNDYYLSVGLGEKEPYNLSKYPVSPKDIEVNATVKPEGMYLEEFVRVCPFMSISIGSLLEKGTFSRSAEINNIVPL